MSTEAETREAGADAAALETGSYEVIRARLLDGAKELGARADRLNDKRKQKFGGTELTVVGNERVRTENNCVPRDIVNVGGLLLFGYNVHLGLRTTTSVGDVFGLHRFERNEAGAFDLGAVPFEGRGAFLADPTFVKEFKELYQYYKDAKLLQLRMRSDGRLLAIFQTGFTVKDIKVFRWAVDVRGGVTYIDNRGDEDHVFPPSHDFEWTATTRDHHVHGRHPHVNVLNEVFVETVGGDLTVKIEDNTDDGKGIYSEPVQEPRQALDDAEIHYAKLGGLILLKVLPYKEDRWRYLVYNTRSKAVRRIDAIGLACLQLPENHGIVFPGGYYLQTGDTKVFDEDTTDLEFLRVVRSPNGEDILYVFHHRESGRTLLLPYNLIRKEVQNPIQCHGYTLFDDGSLVVFRSTSDEPVRVHPMQIWRTPFHSEEFAAKAPKDDSFLTNVGNAELVRGISDAYTIKKLIENPRPTRQLYEDLIAHVNRVIDAYFWLDREETENLRATLDEIKKNAEGVVDEFEKVQAIRRRADEALEEAKATQNKLFVDLRPEALGRVEEYLKALTALRGQRGHLITLRELRYMDLEAVDALEAAVKARFDEVSDACVRFLLSEEALLPLVSRIEETHKQIAGIQKAHEIQPIAQEIEDLSVGLNLLSEVVSGLQIDDITQRTQILEGISEVFGQLNRVRATLQARRKELLGSEGRAEFGAQFKLFGQAVSSGLSMSDTPEKCDEGLSRLLVQLEELESRFSEFDDFLAELAAKREEVYEAFGSKKQQLLDDRQRRAQNLAKAAERILEGVDRRTKSFKEEDELNAYFASDAMIMKLRQLVDDLRAIGDDVKADELDAKLKSGRQNALRNLRDKVELFEGGDNVIKLGKHRFSVNTQAFELTMVPRDGQMALHLTGTDFYETITDPEFLKSRDYWEQQLVSEDDTVYRAEYLAASILFDAERNLNGLDLGRLHHAALDEKELLELVRAYANARYDEGYERGLHDADATRILQKLMAMRETAGLLRYSPDARALACLFWASFVGDEDRAKWHRRAQSLGRLRTAFARSEAVEGFGRELASALGSFLGDRGISASEHELQVAGRYLFEELSNPHPRFTTSREAVELRDHLYDQMLLDGTRQAFEEDLRSIEGEVRERFELAEAWMQAFLAGGQRDGLERYLPVVREAAVLVITPRLEREEVAALTQVTVDELLGQHRRIQDRKLSLRLDEFLSRLGAFVSTRVPGFQAFREARHALLERERRRLRLDEFKPRVLTSFVRNKLLNEVYLPIIGDNLAKQMGTVGANKRTDLMGLLLLISPPGYGKTTLMEYISSRLGMVFMKINGPSLGHNVTSIDPAEAPNATARQEVEKINLALEMGSNVMLYLDDIQHTHPELLQKFISLCDGQRRIEGVWRGQTRTYDLRGKKFAVVMAGNPYTESGEKFQIPDMLANRADTYNLGDILQGKEDVFALSYVENALTSNPVLAPLATRSQDDVYRFIRLAQGEDVPTTDFQHSYSKVESEEIVGVLKKLFQVQAVLLKVNQEYIRSASMDDNFRTEPAFKLQGSYRNMNKLAEKVVSAMNDAELHAVIGDHYIGEAQTLTTGAEQNLLKLAEMRGRMTEAEATRWEEIKKGFRRVQLQGGKDEDPMTRALGTLSGLSDQLDGIRGHIAHAVEVSERSQEKAGQAEGLLLPQLEHLENTLKRLARPELEVHVEQKTDPRLEALLSEHLSAMQSTLGPLVASQSTNLEALRNLSRPLLELIEVMKLAAIDGGRPAPMPTPRTKPPAR